MRRCWIASSAFERLTARAEAAAKAAEMADLEAEKQKEEEREFQNARRYDRETTSSRTTSSRSRRSDSFGESMVKVVIKELKGTTGRRIVRGILGGLFKAR